MSVEAQPRSAAFERGLVALAGLLGALGVATSAAASHVNGSAHLDIVARFLLVHAPALLGLAVLSRVALLRPGLARIAAAVLVFGLVLFCGDLTSRAFRGVGLLPYAAPTGGFAMMAGWLLVAASALVPNRR